ncbi:L-lactate dehydrogenase [Candidatus Saccharibacteria bacterium 32-49-12]|nr:MAG: L-lactate dehydrogenase [Candidatus Saccharibacteria bacterium 32-49-12]
MNRQKAVIVGVGMVGSTAAYTLATNQIVSEIVLIDRKEEVAWGQAADINDAMGLESSVKVRAGSYEDIETDDIVIITAGASQQPGQTRMELAEVNASIMRSVVRDIMARSIEPFIVVVSNPVDVMTYVALEESKLPKYRVFGTGTTLDTSRLKSHLADHLDVNSREVDVYILGEHGDSSFSTIETAQIGEIPIREYPGFEEYMVENIEQQIRDRAYRIIEAKQSTYYGIGQAVAKIVAALRQSSGSVFPVSSYVQGEYGLDGVVLGLPSVVNSSGVRILAGYPLTDRQRAALELSAGVVGDAIEHVSQKD